MPVPTPPLPSTCEAKIPYSNKVDMDICARVAAGTTETSVQAGVSYCLQKCPLVTLHELELLSCPICHNVPQDQIYSCSTGHSFCGKCAEELYLCPLCRIVFKDKSVRNFALERLLDLKRFQCLYDQNGCCVFNMNRKCFTRHLSRCEFHPAATKICHLLKLFHGSEISKNDTCPLAFRMDSILDCSNSGQVYSLIDHLNGTHKFAQAVINFPERSTCQVLLTKILSASSHLPKNKISSNLIIQTCSGSHSPGYRNFKTHGLYLLLIRVDHGEGESKLERTLSLACVRLSPPPASTPGGNRNDEQILFTIKGGEGSDDISWEDEPLSLEDLNTLMTTKAEERSKFKFSLPVTFLQENYVIHGVTGDVMTLLVDFTRTYPIGLGKETGKDVMVVPKYKWYADSRLDQWLELDQAHVLKFGLHNFDF